MKRERWDERYAEQPLVWGRAPNRFVERELEHLPPGRALDLACGEGRNAIWLAERGWEVVAVDFSTVATERALSLARQQGVAIEVVCADVLAGGVEGPFALVLLAYLQLPAAERARVLEIAVEALAPGGTLLLVAHDRRNVTEGHGGPADPELCWTPDEIVEKLGSGFSIDRADTEQRDVEGAPRPALDTLVRARKRV